MCKDGVGDQNLQRAIDYACGAGADCSPILQSGSCFQPNTVKDHCNYAVNSYFQKKGQAQGSCDFSGSAVTSQTPPTSKFPLFSTILQNPCLKINFLHTNFVHFSLICSFNIYMCFSLKWVCFLII